MRSDFTLREFSLAKTPQRLNLLSVGEDSAQVLKKGLRALPGKVKDASEGEGRSLDAADWGNYLKQMIFENSARKRLRLFDHSPRRAGSRLRISTAR